MINLHGITWDHPRGLAPLRGTAAAWEREQGVRVEWTARSLHAFGAQPIEELTAHYDLLVIDHPFAGVAARTGLLLPFDQHLPAEFLQEQAAQSVGLSHLSYQYEGHQWALAIDAAAQVSSYRPDLLERLDASVLRTWDEVLALAGRAHGPWLAMPLSPVNAICSFFTPLCAETPSATLHAVRSRG
jgi:multiple sugar transport system substrate-binding protein